MSTSLPLVRDFRQLKDPRVLGRTTHSLETILVIAGAADFQQVAVFADKRRDWLGRFAQDRAAIQETSVSSGETHSWCHSCRQKTRINSRT